MLVHRPVSLDFMSNCVRGFFNFRHYTALFSLNDNRLSTKTGEGGGFSQSPNRCDEGWSLISISFVYNYTIHHNTAFERTATMTIPLRCRTCKQSHKEPGAADAIGRLVLPWTQETPLLTITSSTPSLGGDPARWLQREEGWRPER